MLINYITSRYTHNITLHPGCELVLYNHFRVWKLERMPLVHYLRPSSDIADLSKDIDFLTQTNNTNNPEIQKFERTLNSFKNILFNNVSLDCHPTIFHTLRSKLNKTKEELISLQDDQSTYYTFMGAHTILHGLSYLILVPIAIFIAIYAKRALSRRREKIANGSINTQEASPHPVTNSSKPWIQANQTA